MRVVVDTSVVVAGLRSRTGASRRWIDSILLREHELLLSVPLVLQYEEVLRRPENLAAHGLSTSEIVELIDAFCIIAVRVELTYRWRPLLRDPDDEMVLETALLGHADVLLTFNLRDFVGAERVEVAVERPGPVWQRLQGV